MKISDGRGLSMCINVSVVWITCKGDLQPQRTNVEYLGGMLDAELCTTHYYAR